MKKKDKIRYAGYALVTSMAIVGDAIALGALMAQRSNGLGDIPYTLGSTAIGVGGLHMALTGINGVNNIVDAMDD